MPPPDLIQRTDSGFHCAAGDFHVDPWRPVDRAIVTHGHADHARPGSGSYLAATPGLGVLRRRLGANARIETLDYGERKRIGHVTVSLHPAGHVLGSAQVRIESAEQGVWVLGGDHKMAPDATCAPFEPVACDTFVSECTFGLPIYRWPDAEQVRAEINAWWAANQSAGRTSVVYAYAFGKAQRVLSLLDPDQGPIFVHGAVRTLIEAYVEAGIALPETRAVTKASVRDAGGRGIVVAPPSAAGTPWLRRFGPISDAMASGWMQVRGARRRRAVDRGFILSDHADWPDLLCTIEATGAAHVGVTHGYVEPFGRYLSEQGRRVTIFRTEYGGDDDATDTETPDEDAS